MEVIQKVTANVEILQIIFKKLNLKEQIQLISVCKEFEYVMENFIWKWKFKEIKILEPDAQYYIKFNDAAKNEYNLTESESQLFFAIIAKHVKQLVIMNRNKEKLTDLYNFTNLILLEFNNCIIIENNLTSLAINCPKLETIHFMYCLNLNTSYFDLNKRGQIEILAEVKSLKHLKLAAHVIFDLSQLNEILNKFCLKSLDLEIFFYRDEVKIVHLQNCEEMESLYINSCYEVEAYLQFEEIYLKNFKNLTLLTLDGSDSIFQDTNLATLAECCNNLQELSLVEWKLFIKEFPKKLKLKKLSLKTCSEITWTNLQQILAELNLEEFVSTKNVYEGTRDFFYGTCEVADTLQIIDIKTKQNREFLEFFKYVIRTPEKLKILRYEYIKHSPFITFKNFAILCANVQELFLTNVAISINDLMELKHIKILKFSIFPTITWSFLATLLTHRFLGSISLEMSEKLESKLNNDTRITNNAENNDEDNDDDENNEDNEYDLIDFYLLILKNNCQKVSLNFRNFETNLCSIKIPFIIFQKHQDMFLDLLNMKSNLRLTLYCYYNPEERLNQTVLNKLLTNKKFPSHIKYIKILNRYYACSDLKDNFRTTVDDVSQNDGCLTVTL